MTEESPTEVQQQSPAESTHADNPDVVEPIVFFPDLPEDYSGQYWATYFLRGWVNIAYSRVDHHFRAPGGSPPPSEPRISSTSPPKRLRQRRFDMGDWWYSLAFEKLLLAWMVVVTREPAIAAVFGNLTNGIGESLVPYAKLREQALDFLESLFGASWPDLQDKVFDDAAERMWKYLHDEKITYEGGCLVYNLRGGGANIDLGEGIKLQRVDASWIKSKFVGEDDSIESSWAVSFEYQVPRSPLPIDPIFPSDDIRSAQDSLAERALLPIRLAHPGGFLTTLAYRHVTSGSFAPSSPGILMDKSWLNALFGAESLPDLPAFPIIAIDPAERYRLVNVVSSIPPPGQGPAVLNTAVRSFQASFKRASWQDAVVDRVTTMESLFSRENDELAYRVAIRCALLLGTDSAIGKRIFRVVKKLYSLRSDIVHGNENPGDSAKGVIHAWMGSPLSGKSHEWYGLMAAHICSQVAAASLRAFLHLEKEGKDPFPKSDKHSFLQELDELAFDQLSREKLQKVAKVNESRTEA